MAAPVDALFLAAKQGLDDDMKELVVLDGLDLNSADSLGNTAVHYAAAAEHPKCVSLLINAKVDVTRVNHMQETALHMACARNAVRSGKLLVAAGASLEARDKQGHLPMDLCKPGLLRDAVTPVVHLDMSDSGESSEMSD